MPCASPESLAEAGRHADRLSVNIELPTPESLGRLAPDKDEPTILDAMRCLRAKIDEARAEPRQASFVPAGQSTQMIIGADASTDRTILAASSRLYAEHRLGRVYYSAFSPIPHASPALPARAAPVLREHRLYQADWLMRFYGFAQSEILDAGAGEMLDLQIDPKLAWALRHRDRFTVDVNKADRSQLLRVPGLGKRTVDRLLTTRRQRSVGLEDLRRLRVAIKTARPFVVTADRRGARARRTRPACQAYAESAAARPVRRECLPFWCGTTRISPDGGSGRGRWSRPAFRRRRSPGERTRSRATFSPNSRLKWSPMPMLALSRETQTSCAFRAASSSAPTFTLLRSLRAGSAGMRRTILTPDRCAFWNGRQLAFGPGAAKRKAPIEDALEDLWRSYYASIFNPARPKLAAMKAQMPVRYWANLPEAQMIRPLARRSASRAEAMIGRGPRQMQRARPHARQCRNMGPHGRLARSAAASGCPLSRLSAGCGGDADSLRRGAAFRPADAGRGAAGRSGGRARASFRRPAGEILDRALRDAGIDRNKVWVTNAVKHFKFLVRGKRRLHQKPNIIEIEACRPWLEAEIDLVRPEMIVALGASASRSLLRSEVRINACRGRFFTLQADRRVMVTIHPSYLLRLPESAPRAIEYRQFVANLAQVRCWRRCKPPSHNLMANRF